MINKLEKKKLIRRDYISKKKIIIIKKYKLYINLI